MRTNLTDDSKIITLWPAESISRGDRSRLPFRRIWQSTRPNFSPCSQPQHFRTLQGIFSRELAGNSCLHSSGFQHLSERYAELGVPIVRKISAGVQAPQFLQSRVSGGSVGCERQATQS